MKALSDFLRPEFLNRVDEIITFNSLTQSDFINIARIMMSDLSSALAEKGITLISDEDVYAYIADKSYSRKFGARNMRRFIESVIEDKIADIIINSGSSAPSRVRVSSVNGTLEIKAENE